MTMRLSSLRTLALGVVSCAYPLAAGLYVLGNLRGGGDGGGGAGGSGFSSGPDHILFRVVGGDPTYWVYVGSAALAFGLARAPLARRVAAGFGLVGFGFALNPLLSELLALHVTGRGTYWRAMWLLPLPLLVAITLTAFIPRPGHRGREARIVVVTVGLALLLIFVPKQSTFGGNNGTAMSGPGPKVWSGRRVAQVLVEELKPGQRALAQPDISRWLPTFNDHPTPLLVKPTYLKMSTAERDRRLQMQRCVAITRPSGCNRRWFEQGLDDYRVAGVVFDRRMQHESGLRKQLKRRHFRWTHRRGNWVYYTRELSPESP
jgi:hypothetical protein